jgi:hypothetical protein
MCVKKQRVVHDRRWINDKYTERSKSFCATGDYSTKTRKNILNSFNHHDNVVRIRDNRWHYCESTLNVWGVAGGTHFKHYL